MKLTKNNNPDEQYVPHHAKEIKVDTFLLKQVIDSIELNLPLLLISETGAGKTSLVRWLAKQTNNAYRRVNLNGNTTVDEFKGKLIPDEETGKWKWVDGVLIEAMRKGHWLLLDEINAAQPEILFTLNSLLDDDRYVVIEEKDGEVVHPHPNFRLFASMNPTGRYTGTKELNIALKSRFAVVQFPETDKNKQVSIMRSHFPEMRDKFMKILAEISFNVNKNYHEGKSELFISPRDLLMVLTIFNRHYTKEMHEDTDLGMEELRDAFIVGILNKTDDKEERLAIAHIANIYLGNMFDSQKKPNKTISLDTDELLEALAFSVNWLKAMKGSKTPQNKDLLKKWEVNTQMSIDNLTMVCKAIKDSQL